MSTITPFEQQVEQQEAIQEPRIGDKMTADEFERLPKLARKYELISGEVRMSPAGLRHDEVALQLGAEIVRFLKSNPIGHAYGSSAGFRLTDDLVLSPDVSFVLNERLPERTSPDSFGHFTPDLAVEVISPSDSALDVETKVQIYLNNGVKLVWVINPRLKTATIHRADGSIQRILSDDWLDGEDVLPGFKCKLNDIL